MALTPDALNTLEETSRTFFLPIMQLDGRLQEAVGAAYLCFRSIDEIEDDPVLDAADKAKLLRGVGDLLQTSPGHFEPGLDRLFSQYNGHLPAVTTRLAEWACIPCETIAPRIWDATAAMARRMACWAEVEWCIRDEADLDAYTFGVAGAVGLLLSDLWGWHDGLRTDRRQALGFGRGLQSVNILRNREEDRSRGVNFFPEGWDRDRMFAYCRTNLELADAYVEALPEGPIEAFCAIPLLLAHATLEALEDGREKLSREEVLGLIAVVTNQSGPTA